MAKPNAFLIKMQNEIRENMRIAQYSNERQCLDAMILALNDGFGFGADRVAKFLDFYVQNRTDVARMFLDDRYKNGDKELTYSKEKCDRALRRIMGDSYPSFDERYNVDIRKGMYDGGIVLK